MAKLRIKHFGPITEGCDSDDGFITFDKYTLFIGDQGTGKSTVAKLFAIGLKKLSFAMIIISTNLIILILMNYAIVSS